MRILQYLQIHKQMKILRIKADMTQKAMAAELELSVPTYSNYENGYSEPSIEIIQKFCMVLGISEADFFGYIMDDIGVKVLHRRRNNKVQTGKVKKGQ